MKSKALREFFREQWNERIRSMPNSLLWRETVPGAEWYLEGDNLPRTMIIKDREKVGIYEVWIDSMLVSRVLKLDVAMAVAREAVAVVLSRLLYTVGCDASVQKGLLPRIRV